MSPNIARRPSEKTAADVIHRSSVGSNGGSNEVVTAQGDKLNRQITIRHMVFIALGGSIGAGLFISSGAALASGGPLNLVLCFTIVGFGVGCTMGCLGELAGEPQHSPRPHTYCRH